MDDVVRVLPLDQHVGLADCPGFIIPVLAKQFGLSLGVQFADVRFRYRQHAASTTGRIIDSLHYMAAGKIILWSQKQVDHQFDHLTRREVLSGLLIGLFRPNPDQFLEHIPHLHAVHSLRG